MATPFLRRKILRLYKWLLAFLPFASVIFVQDVGIIVKVTNYAKLGTAVLLAAFGIVGTIGI